MSDFKSEKKGSNIICRVSNATPEMVCKYVSRLPKKQMSESAFRDYMGKGWFQNEHQAPEQWGLYYIDGVNYYPRFSENITLKEAERYLKGWMKRLIVINPYTRFKTICDRPMVKAIVEYMESHPNEHDLKTIFSEIIGGDEAFIINDIIANALNNYAELFTIVTIDKENEKFNIVLNENYKEILETKYNMTKKEYFDSFNDIQVKSLLDGKEWQVIYYGAPGTGKSHEIKKTTDTMPIENVFRTTFHPDSDYSTFVGCYKPTQVKKAVRNVAGDVVKAEGHEVFENTIQYEFVPQAFLKAYKRAYETDESIVLVIEEINRGNCAQIFGDLFQLLDRKDGVSEYPIDADEDLRKYLIDTLGEDSPAIANGKLCLPSNLYIWATMNTSDQSLFPIDSAFKRRWEWKYMKIANMEKGYKIEVNGKHYDWWNFIDKMNTIIGAATSSEDKKLGYFFCKVKEGTTDITAEQFVSKVLFYIYGDALKDYDIKDDSFKKEEKDGKKIYYSFSDFYDAKGNVDKEMVAKLLDTFIGADEKATNEENQAKDENTAE